MNEASVNPVSVLNRLVNVLGCRLPYKFARSFTDFFLNSVSAVKSATACCIRNLLIYVLKLPLCSLRNDESVLRLVFNFLTKSSNNTFVKRSEEHTSELQSRPHLVCRLLLEKKKRREVLNRRPVDI